MDITLVPGGNPGPYTGAGNNTYLISGKTPTLLDAATGESSHLAGLAEALAGQPLGQVLVSHAHQDHVDGCGQIAARWPGTCFRKMLWPERDRLQLVDFFSISDGDLIPAGDGMLRVVHTPGHAPDHLCFLDETTGTLFSADLVVQGSSVVIPNSHGGSLTQYLASLRRVLDIAPDRMLPAHGQAIDSPSEVLSTYLEHRLQRETQIMALVRVGVGRPDALVQRLYPGIRTELKPMARESVLAHLVKLQEEGRARDDGEYWVLT